MVGGSRNFAGMLQKCRLIQACVYLLQAWVSPPRQCDQKESFDPSHDNDGPTSNIGLNDGRYEQRSYDSQSIQNKSATCKICILLSSASPYLDMLSGENKNT